MCEIFAHVETSIYQYEVLHEVLPSFKEKNQCFPFFQLPS